MDSANQTIVIPNFSGAEVELTLFDVENKVMK
jgi:hypothetical protein